MPANPVKVQAMIHEEALTRRVLIPVVWASTGRLTTARMDSPARVRSIRKTRISRTTTPPATTATWSREAWKNPKLISDSPLLTIPGASNTTVCGVARFMRAGRATARPMVATSWTTRLVFSSRSKINRQNSQPRAGATTRTQMIPAHTVDIPCRATRK